MLNNLIAVIIAVAIGAAGYAWWSRKDAEESPLMVMVTQMRTRAIIEHERQVTVWYKACPEVRGINPQVMVIWPAKLNYELAQGSTPGQIAALLKMVPISQVLYGTDYPFRPGAEVNEGIAEYGFSAADVRAIERENALALLPRLKA